ncbi:MAG: M24 family metallopeptidase [Chloroflexota bacterium]
MRLAKLRQTLTDQGLDAMLITDEANRRYLSGFTGSAGMLVISQDRALLATDFRYYEQATLQAPHFELIRLTDKFSLLLPDLVAGLGVRRLGFESKNLTFDQHASLAAALPAGVEFAPTADTVLEMRAVKDEGELAALRRAIAVSDAAYAHMARFMRPGMTEKEVAWELERFMRTAGADKVSFDIIVAAGPNGAMPHARPGEAVIRPGQAVVMDFGAVVEGYHSDLTRTVVLGEADGTYRQVYDIVLQAQQAAIAGIRPGMTGQEADAIAREVIQAAGYGEFFGHGLGHGVGLVIHEKPGVGRLSDKDVLQPGMVFSVEPGIYLPGEFGVRLEDLVVLREHGPEVLSLAAKEPLLPLG